MVDRIQAQVQAEFSPDSGGDLLLIIEHDPTKSAGLDVHLLLFPAVDAELVCSAGSARFGATKSVGVPGGVVAFTGSSVIQIPKRPIEVLPMRVLRASDAEGSSIPIGISYDQASSEIRASAACYGAVALDPYRAYAREIIYTPLVESFGGGSRTTFGTIVAFLPPRSQTIFEVQPFDTDTGNIELELYRIVSNSVTNRDGEFERPPDFPASGAYPDQAFVLDMGQALLETERVHEIGYMDLRRGFGYARPYHVRILEPYVGSTTYVPTKRIIESPLPAEKFTADEIAKARNFIASRGYGKL